MLIIGVFLVLKNMSLIGDGLAHVSFAAIAIGLLVSDKPIIISIPIVIVASFLVLLLKEKAKIDIAKKYFEALKAYYEAKPDNNIKIVFKERINKTQLSALINDHV